MRLGSPSRRKPARRAATGFTLVELLVVIGIIALLIGILLPSLSKARAAANQVKCETALRSIGQGFLLYSNEFGGYFPPVRMIDNDSAYTIGDDSIATGKNIYWFNFIAPQVSAHNMGNAGVSANGAAQGRVRNVLWGCPAFEGYKKNSVFAGDDTNQTQPGYGMNLFPKMDPENPTYDGIGPSSANEIVADENYIVWSGGKADASGGRFFKANEYTQSGIRGLVADCQLYVWESRTAPATVANIPQNVTTQRATGASVGSALFTADAQTLVDLFRHGQAPGTVGTGGNTMYTATGGRIGYNVLYCDGHVDQCNNATEAYRAQRMRWPN